MATTISRRRICKHCGRTYLANRYNAQRQKFCDREKCQRERKQIRQRRSYKKRYRDDKEFQAKERERSREAIARRRAAKAVVPPEPLEAQAELDRHVILGLIAAVNKTTDQQQVATTLRLYAQQGRQLERRIGLSAAPIQRFPGCSSTHGFEANQACSSTLGPNLTPSLSS